jgi:trehalose synthase
VRIVPVWPRSIDDYREVVSNEVVTELQRRAWERPGTRMLHINSTEYGGGVAEVLLAQIPLLQDLGIDADWGVIDGDERFFEITKACHNGIQGNRELVWTEDMNSHYLQVLRGNLDGLPQGYDVAVVHDPQPAALPYLLGPRRHEVAKRWVDQHEDELAFCRVTHLAAFAQAIDAELVTLDGVFRTRYAAVRIVDLRE